MKTKPPLRRPTPEHYELAIMFEALGFNRRQSLQFWTIDMPKSNTTMSFSCYNVTTPSELMEAIDSHFAKLLNRAPVDQPPDMPVTP